MIASQRAATQSNALRAGGLVFLGGSLGTALRALVGLTLPVGWVALPTLVVNVVGAFAIGVLGGYTTFSTAMWDSVTLLRERRWACLLYTSRCV